MYPETDTLASEFYELADDGGRGGEKPTRKADARTEFKETESERHTVLGALEIALLDKLAHQPRHGGLRHVGSHRERGDRQGARLLHCLENCHDAFEHRRRIVSRSFRCVPFGETHH